MERRDETVPIADMVAAFVVDDPSPDAPSRADLEGCDVARGRAELVARLRRGPMSLRERAAALIVAGDLALDRQEDDLAAVLLDPSLSPSGRSCALALLRLTRRGDERIRAAHDRIDAPVWAAIQDEKLTLELALQLPAPGLADALATQLLRVREHARQGAWERLERCRLQAGLPALVAWRRALVEPALGSLHHRMTAGIIDEAGEGSAVVLDTLWQTAPNDEARRTIGRAAAGRAAYALRRAPSPAVGVTHRLESPSESVRWLVCVPHPGGMTLVAQARATDDSLFVREVVILPTEPSVGLIGPADAPLTLSYRVVPNAETRPAAIARARAMLARDEALTHELSLLLCLLDGVPSPVAPAAPSPSTLD